MLYRLTFTIAICMANAGCIGHYLYQSPGVVETHDGKQVSALLYWKGDDGRLWYNGKRYVASDSSVSMIVCEFTPSLFDGGEENVAVMLKSKPGDRKVGQVDEGALVRYGDPQPLEPGSNCGQIYQAGKTVPAVELSAGATPDVSVLCDNPQRPGRYPAAGVYRFAPISRTRARGHDTEPMDVCAAPAPGSAGL